MPRVLIYYESKRIRKMPLKCERLEVELHVHYEEIQMFELNLDTTRRSLLIGNPCGGRKLPHPRLLLPLKDYANTSLVSAGGSCVQQIHNNYCFLFLVSFKKRLLNTTGTLKNLLSFGGFTSCLTGILRRNFAKLE